MITIFCKIATDFLIQGIDAIHRNSLEGDESIIKTARDHVQSMLVSAHIGFFNVQRNTNLSELKRAELAGLRTNIKKLGCEENPETEDRATFEQLKGQLSASQGMLTNLCKSQNKDEGYTGALLSRLVTFLELMHKKICEDMKLNNTTFAPATALRCIQYYAAMSCAHYLFDERFRKNWQDFELLHEKEALIMANLRLAEIDIKGSTAVGAKERIITFYAKAVRDENELINSRYRFRIGGSLMGEDHLKRYMTEAITTLSCSRDMDFNDEAADNAAMNVVT